MPAEQTRAKLGSVLNKLRISGDAKAKEKHEIIDSMIKVPEVITTTNHWGVKEASNITQKMAVNRIYGAYKDYHLIGDRVLAAYARDIRQTDTGKIDERKFQQTLAKLLVKEGLGRMFDYSKIHVNNDDHVDIITAFAANDFKKAEKEIHSAYNRGLNYEDEVATELNKNGLAASKTKSGADFGADIIFTFLGKTFCGQCKALKGVAGVKSVQEVLPAMAHYSASGAVVFSKQGFSDSAKELAETNGIALVTGTNITSLVRQLAVMKIHD